MDGGRRREIGDWCERYASELALNAEVERRISARARLRTAVDARDDALKLRGRQPELVARIVAKSVGPKLDKAGRMLLAVTPRRAYGHRPAILAKAANKFNCTVRTADECWNLVRRLNKEAAAIWSEISRAR